MEAEELLKKIKNFKEADKIDLSSKEDLAIAAMNLISIEEHLFFTYGKTNKEKYLELLNEVRQMRKKYLAEIVKNPEGEIWCISKHLLASIMRLMEVGTKMLNDGKKDEAKDLFEKALNLWNIFWGLNLNLLDVKDVALDDGKEIKLEKNKKVSVFETLGKIVNKILDCCRE
ncbi:MAG: hypothetical protein NTX55_01690 [Candidatus Parcubacteria bacterium]|nr:hypothetical protein [Candidatus Parcubacteria bacterium]